MNVTVSVAGVAAFTLQAKFHLRMKVNLKPYHCPVCPESFRVNHSAKQHIKEKHPEVVQGDGVYQRDQDAALKVR